MFVQSLEAKIQEESGDMFAKENADDLVLCDAVLELVIQASFNIFSFG